MSNPATLLEISLVYALVALCALHGLCALLPRSVTTAFLTFVSQQPALPRALRHRLQAAAAAKSARGCGTCPANVSKAADVNAATSGKPATLAASGCAPPATQQAVIRWVKRPP